MSYLDATTEAGRRALAEVMTRSYTAEVESVLPRWARVRLADGEPVSFILVDPNRWMDFPRGALRYAFICDVATREDRRGQGHFRGIMEHSFERLRAAGVPVVVTHGRYPLYRRFGFEVFTHHAGLFITPEQVQRALGSEVPAGARDLLTLEQPERFHRDDLLIVIDIKAEALPESHAALLAAAAAARELGKARILFEHPAAPSYGSRYPLYPSPETVFARLARACGAQHCLQGADPEGGAIPDADWIKVLDAPALLRAVLPLVLDPGRELPRTAVSLQTEAGRVPLESTAAGVRVLEGPPAGVPALRWPAAALAQLVTGYQPIEVLCALHGAPLPQEALEFLGEIFPPCWRFSRNESWTFKT